MNFLIKKKDLKKEIKRIYFVYNNFTVDNFIDKVVDRLDFNTSYSLLIKLSYNNIHDFKMCGSQIGLSIHDNHDLDFYRQLYDVINIRIEHTFDNYVMIESINTIELSFFIIDSLPELKLKNIYKLEVPKHISNLNNIRSFFNNRLLPFTTDTRYYGQNIIDDYLCQTYLDKIKEVNKNIHSLLDCLNNKDLFFIYSSKERKFSKSIMNKKVLIISKSSFNTNLQDRQHQNTSDYIRYVFDFNTGIYLFHCKDTCFLEEGRDSFVRTINNTSLDIRNQYVNNLKISIKLQSLSKPKYKQFNTGINEKWGVFDIETYKNKDGINKIYAVGFLVNGHNNESNLYYIDNDLDSNKVLIKAINEMLNPIYNNFIYYCHNFGKYDAIFLYKILLDYNKNLGREYFILNSILRDGVIIRLDVKIKKLNNSVKISFLDSINLLKGSLQSLQNDFEVESKKGQFPYEFVNENNLFYIGNKPDLSFYDGKNGTLCIADAPDSEHSFDTNWDLKLETLLYLDKDLKCLLEILNKFNKILFINYNTDMTDALTITRVALNIFYQKHPDKLIDIPLINKMDIYNFIKKGYFGGITEVYIPYGEELFYIDVNSLYPFASINNPLPGGNSCTYMESFSDEGLNLDGLFGFFYAKIETTDNYFGLLPVRSENNSVIFPNGKFSGVWSSEELKFAKENGYKVKVIKGYHFNKIYNIFEDYVLNLYGTKVTSEGAKKATAKSLLNNLIGRLGLNSLRPQTDIVDNEKFQYISSTRKINSHHVIDDNFYLISYDNIIDKDICREHSLEYEKILDKEKTQLEKIDLYKDVSISIAAMVTSYARIFMNKIKLDIYKNGGQIYYMDTDSLVLDKKGFNYLHIQSGLNIIGDNLGQFKIEHIIKKGIFISNKTYCLVLNNNTSIIKAKGAINTDLTFEKFQEMYFSQNNIITKKNNTKTLYDKGSVVLNTIDITLRSDSYTKRKKIFNGIQWINTKPLEIISDF